MNDTRDKGEVPEEPDTDNVQQGNQTGPDTVSISSSIARPHAPGHRCDRRLPQADAAAPMPSSSSNTEVSTAQPTGPTTPSET